MQRLDDGRPGVHLDIHTDDVDAEVDRLEKLGAERVQQVHSLWWVMRDPAGMEFCVVWALNEVRPQEVRDDFERRAKQVG